MPLAIATLAVLGGSPVITPTTPAGMKTVSAEVRLADTELWGMGGSGTPIPSQSLIDEIWHRFVDPDPPYFPGQPQFPVDSAHPVFTPEGLYPAITGVKSLELDPSVAQGVSILDATIKGRIDAGHDLVVAGGSQSSTVASLEMRDLLALPAAERPTADQLSFVLLVDPSNPNGGLLERFGDPSLPPLTIPSLGVTFSGATPADTPWDTAIYNVEYDGFSDFPRYPLNFLADLNAAFGIVAVHPEVEHLSDALTEAIVRLPVSDDYTGHTEYFMVPTENLPLLDPLRFIPVLGNPLADLLQPDLKVLVNLGYGQIEHGWDPGPANIPTPIGLFPTNIDPAEVLTALVNGAEQGIRDFVDDINELASDAASTGGPTGPADLPSLADLASLADLPSLTDLPSLADLPSLTEIVNAFSSAAAHAYAALLPIADVANALMTTLPAYELSLFTHELAAGDLLGAIGLPIGAGYALGTIADGFALGSVLHAAKFAIEDFQDLFAS